MSANSKRNSRASKKSLMAARNGDRGLSDDDRMFEHFSRRMDRSWPPMFRGFGPMFWRSFELPETRRAFADLIDAGKEYRVHVEVPGISKDKLNISVTPHGAKIEGEAEKNIDEQKEGYVHRERTWSKVRRELSFPEEVIPDQADAIVKDGVLELKIPKKNPTEIKTHKVQVR
jgi:HSP20 family protein